MAVQIILKNSSIEDKKPTPSQLTNGEISLNYSSAGAFLCCTDTDGNTQQVGGVKIAENAPDAPVKQSLWFKPSTLTLSVYDGDKWLPIAGGGNGGGGGGGDIIQIIGNDGIDADTVAGIVTLDVELAGGDDGLEFKSSKLSATVASAADLGSVKVGNGVDVTSDGTISIDVGSGIEFDGSGNIQVAVDDERGIELTADGIAAKLGVGLSFDGDGKIKSDATGGVKGTVDVTGTDFPASPQDGEFYINVADGNFSSDWAAVTDNADETTDATAGDLLLYQAGGWEYIPTGGTVPPTDLGIDNRTEFNLDVTSTTGEDATVPAATASLAGLMTAADKVKVDAIPDNPNNLDDRYLKLAADAGDQTVASTGTTTFDGLVEAGDGVSVTGGSVVDTGITKVSGALQIFNEGESAIYMSDANNNLSFFGGTSAGAKVGGGNKEKRRGFVFAASSRDATEDGTTPSTGFMGIQGQTQLEPGKAVENISCFFANSNNNQEEALVKNQYGYYASNTLRTAFNNYGFYTDLGEDNNQGGVTYSFHRRKRRTELF